MRVLRKLSKIDVDYRPSEGKRKCGNCSMYQKGTCTLVAGDIRRNDVCDKWEPKK